MFPPEGPRRVTVCREQNGTIIVVISRHNDWLMYVLILAAFTAGFLFFAWIFVSPVFRNPLSSRELILLFPIGFILLWYFGAVRIGMWRAFGVEQIVVGSGVFTWKRTALFWKRILELPVDEVMEVEPVTPWHDLSNHVEFTVRGRRNRIGDMLRRDETYEIADALRHAPPHPRSATRSVWSNY
jgi:hypothetical protein